jgi:hypothetical protein
MVALVGGGVTDFVTPISDEIESRKGKWWGWVGGEGGGTRRGGVGGGERMGGHGVTH